MFMNKKIGIWVVIILVLLGSGTGYYIWNKNQSSEAASLIDPVSLLVFDIKADNLTDYQKDIAFQRFNAAKNQIMTNIDTNSESAESNQNFEAWLEVAVAQKSINDFDRAADIWIWFTEAYDHNSISPANLGDLYKSFVVDNDKSEKYYKIALDRDKTDWQIFLGFYELYRYNFNDPDKAIAVLRDGAKHNPDNKNYVVELANYFLVLEDKESAKEVIEEFISRHPAESSLRNKLK
jgi:tetratricopeptide (TPR) repeat protein